VYRAGTDHPEPRPGEPHGGKRTLSQGGTAQLVAKKALYVGAKEWSHQKGVGTGADKDNLLESDH